MTGNPLWGIPLKSLSATRERPIFLPSRRPPAPAVAAAPAQPPKPPPPPAEPERPALRLLGIVTGTSDGSGTASDYTTLAYDATTGSRLWLKRYNGSGNGYDYAEGLAVSPDGTKVFVTGGSWGAGSDDYATVAYGAG